MPRDECFAGYGSGRRALFTRRVEPAPETEEATRGKVMLSPREEEIARMVAAGYPNKTIAAVLDISSWTVGHTFGACSRS